MKYCLEKFITNCDSSLYYKLRQGVITNCDRYVIITVMMASAQVVETSVNTNNSPSQDYTTNPDDHSNHNRYVNTN